MDGPIASAVVLPEQHEEPPSAQSPTSQKRRQSSVSEGTAKRPRLNGDDAATDHRDHTNDAQPSAPKQREKGRERRLFGAALGALSQNTATAAQKRRAEIEKRQQAERRIEEAESEQRKLERAGQRKVQRLREQKQFEKDSMTIRHDQMLYAAHFLLTKTEPQLYYKPWETVPEEEQCIQNQIEQTRALIRRELDEHEAEEAQRERHASRKGDADHDAEASQTGKESNADARQQPPTAQDSPKDSDPPPEDPDMKDDHAEAVREQLTNDNAQSKHTTTHESVTDDGSKEAMDETGEEIVEAAEDTVIY